MTGKVARSSLVGVVLAITVVAGVPGVAFERGAARTSSLQRDVQVLSPRTLREPSAAAYDLKRLQRRLHEQRIEAPRDPRVPALDLETRRLRWHADRAARRSTTAVDLPRTSALVTGAPIEKPRDLGGSHTPPGMRAARLDVGQRVVVLQRDVVAIEERLARGEAMTAAELLAVTEADLAGLRGAVSNAIANDPNLLVLESRLQALRQRLQELE